MYIIIFLTKRTKITNNFFDILIFNKINQNKLDMYIIQCIYEIYGEEFIQIYTKLISKHS